MEVVMNRHHIIAGFALSVVVALSAISVVAEQKTLKDQIVGIWALVSATEVKSDGTKSDMFGPNPKGIYMFTATGKFSQILIRSDLPSFPSRAAATAEQAKHIVQGSIAQYGTYTVDEASKVINLHYWGSTFTAFIGRDGKRNIISITANELHFYNPATSEGTMAEVVLKRTE
jgi:Lipocalin-like domain